MRALREAADLFSEQSFKSHFMTERGGTAPVYDREADTNWAIRLRMASGSCSPTTPANNIRPLKTVRFRNPQLPVPARSRSSDRNEPRPLSVAEYVLIWAVSSRHS
jgi:hypothetical protein